jgi:outer membrane receptor for ferrienterochelin and colicins
MMAMASVLALPARPALFGLLAVAGGWAFASPSSASASGAEPAPAIAPVQVQTRGQTQTQARPDTILQGEEIIVRSTRSGRRIQDQAIRVEVLDREEIEEKLLMRPGNIAMLLAETGGVQLQNTSAGLGGSVIRIQGMPGRYTLLLADGLPLYGGQPGGLGVLQIPPVDLEQVEIIKGVASALYGGQALGGVVNLVSRRPGDEALAEFIVNGTSRGGADLVAYGETPLPGAWPGAWKGSITSGLHRQDAKDLSGSGWADLPAHERGTLRARAFHDDDSGRSAMITVGGMMEDRVGGSVPGGVVPGEAPLGGLPFRDAVDSRRFDAGVHFRTPLGLPEAMADAAFLDLRGSAMESRFDRDYGLEGSEAAGRGERSVRFLEASLSGMRGAHTWVVGAALQDDRFRHLDVPSPSVPLDFEHTVPGIFVQDEVRLLDGDMTVAGSLRWDRHSAYGSQLSPRLSVLLPGDVWTVRASAGRGFFGPTPLLDEVEAVGLLGAAPGAVPGPSVDPETGWGGSLDVGGRSGPFEWNGVAFASEVRDEATLFGTSQGFRVGNAPWRTTTRGGELLLRYRVGEVSVTGSYLFVDAQRRSVGDAGNHASSPVPRTPRHATGLVAVWEDHDRGILGLELYHTGRQPLEDNPYRNQSRGWLHVGVLGELRLEGWSLFVNMENLLGVRQTRWDPLLLPAPGRYGARVTDAWAPLDGFTLNAGVRIRRGGGHGHHDNQDDHDHP